MKSYLFPLLILVFFTLIYCEWKYSKKQLESVFRIESSILNIACGIMERVFDLYFFIFVYFCFVYIEQSIGLFEISLDSFSNWLVLFLLLDFILYWFHRSGHTINLLWGAHVIHHQCEEFNLTVAFRNSVFPHIFRSIYLLILPILGFPAEMIIVSLTISVTWGFFIHTKAIDSLGFLEYFMMTPSHHRVHHGTNPEYIDKNFGGVFIIWDKLFGTFQKELVKVNYGITSPLKTWNPLHAYTHVWRDLYQVSKVKTSITEKLKIWLGTPSDFYIKYNSVNSGNVERRRNNIPRNLIFYIIVQLAITSGLLVSLLAFNESLSLTSQFVLGTFVIGSSVILCMLMETHQNVFKYERFRILSMISLPMLFQSWWLVALIAFIIPVSMVWATLAEERLIFLNSKPNVIE